MNYFKHDQALVEPGARIGDGTRIWAFAHVQAGAAIGEDCNICNGTFIEKGSVIGNHVTIKHNVSIFNGVVIGDDVFVASNIAFINDRYPRSHRQDAWTLERTEIKRGATLGCNATILCGITIGEYAVIGAGSVVTKDVPAHAIMLGNPGEFQGFACFCGRSLDEKLTCRCGQRFVKEKNSIKPMG